MNSELLLENNYFVFKLDLFVVGCSDFIVWINMFCCCNSLKCVWFINVFICDFKII